MNETLYSWTFKFHKALRQQNSGVVTVVKDFILPYAAPDSKGGHRETWQPGARSNTPAIWCRVVGSRDVQFRDFSSAR